MLLPSFSENTSKFNNKHTLIDQLLIINRNVDTDGSPLRDIRDITRLVLCVDMQSVIGITCLISTHFRIFHGIQGTYRRNFLFSTPIRDLILIRERSFLPMKWRKALFTESTYRSLQTTNERY